MQDAASHGAAIANHVECAALLSKDGKAVGIGAVDRLSDTSFEIRASHVVNATGPWAEKIASQLLPGQKQARLTASKGIHIVTLLIAEKFAIAVSGKGEHGFVLPWKGISLVGTTDNSFSGDAGSIQPTEREIAVLVAKMTRLLPQAREFLDKRTCSFAGVRALPGSDGDTYRASREVAVCDHARDGVSGFYSVFGGKWTTARLIAERLLDRLSPRIAQPTKACDTATAVIRAASASQSLDARLEQAAEIEMAVTEDDFARRIGRPDMLAKPLARHGIKTWLATRVNSRNSGAGH